MTDKKRIIQLAVQGNRGMNRGHAVALKSRLARIDASRNGSVQAQRKFIDSLVDQGRPSAPGAYPHPAQAPRSNVDRRKKTLDPSDLAWLDRLPRDPEKVRAEDATTLHWLLISLKESQASKSDIRLVSSVYSPVKARHDRAEAEHNLELARRPLPQLSNEAFAAVKELCINEDSSTDPEWVSILAERELKAAYAEESRRRDEAIASAQRRVDAAGAVDEDALVAEAS